MDVSLSPSLFFSFFGARSTREAEDGIIPMGTREEVCFQPQEGDR